MYIIKFANLFIVINITSIIYVYHKADDIMGTLQRKVQYRKNLTLNKWAEPYREQTKNA